MTYPIVDAALENHVAILGKTGSGKSNAAKTAAERLLSRGKRVCAIDPTGTWWGLRLSADGKQSSPWPVVIFGGEHADLPLAPEHGAAIAETIGSSSTSAIIDTRQMTVGGRTQFFTAFAETLISKNQGELTVIIDEAHLFAPQSRVNDPKSSALVHATNNLVSLGRGIGLRIMLLSQRPAKLHKDSLTQVETLVAMRLIAPQDRGAIRDWVAEWADKAKGEEIISSLPSLPNGDAWVWSPELNLLSRQHFPLVATYDSGRPRAGKKQPNLKPIDVDAIKERLTIVAKEAVANDPRTLKTEIARLKTIISSTTKEAAKIVADPKAVEEAEQRGFAEGVEKAQWAIVSKVRELGDSVGELLHAFNSTKATLDLFLREGWKGEIPKARTTTQSTKFPKTPSQVNRSTKSNWHGDPSLSRSQRRVLASVAFWKSIGHDSPTREQVAAVAGYSPSSGGFNNLVGSLRTAGHLDIPMAGRMALTPTADADIPSLDEAREKMRDVLSGSQKKIVDAALSVDGAVSRAAIAEATAYSESSGGFNNLIGSLCTLGILTKPGAGHVAVSDWAREVLT